MLPNTSGGYPIPQVYQQIHMVLVGKWVGICRGFEWQCKMLQYL